MTSVSEEDVQRWFDVVLQWGSADTSEKCRDTFECLDELLVFLKQLENALGGLVCINPAETQPRGGHLGIFWVGMCRAGLQIGTPF